MLLESIENKRQRDKIKLICDICSIEFLRKFVYFNIGRKKHNKDICQFCIRKMNGERERLKNAGKKLEEIHGDEKAKEIRSLLSSQRMGDKNHNFGGVHQKFPIRTGTLESQFGIDKANEIKKKLSIVTSGKNNPMYGKPSPSGSGRGISGHYKTFYFRSLLELSYILFLEENNIPFESCDGKRKYRFEYQLNGKDRTYYPDFFLFDTNEVIEVKPTRLTKTLQNQEKAKSVTIPFRFVTEHDISKITPEKLKPLIDSGVVDIDSRKQYLLKF